MASWDPDAQVMHPLDYRLVEDTFVTKVHRVSLLDETMDWLRLHAYQVVELDTGAWSSAAAMFDDLAAGLDFPEHFGRNLDAVDDCMRDVAAGKYGWHSGATGLVVVLKAFDSFVAVDGKTAQTLLDIMANHARRAILIGHRLLCLVQSNDPRMHLDPVGATPVMWNDAETRGSRSGV